MSAKGSPTNKGAKGSGPGLSLEKLLKRVQDGSQGLRSLEQIFDSSTNVLDYASRSFGCVQLAGYLKSHCAGAESLYGSFKTVAAVLTQLSAEFGEGCQTLQQEVADPLQNYTEDYERNLARLTEEENRILSEISEGRRTVDASKDSYFRAASQLEKVQIALQTMISSIEKGNFSFNNMINPKTGKMTDRSCR